MIPLCPRSGIGLDWSPKLVSHQRLLGFNEALICLSYSGGVKFAFRRLVVPRGIAPRSSGYQPDALLLSYRTEKVNRETLLRTPRDVVDRKSTRLNSSHLVI